MGMKQLLTKAALSTAMSCISGAPEKNLPKLLKFMESIGWGKEQREMFYQILDDSKNIWYKSAEIYV